MIDTIIDGMISNTKKMQELIMSDIEDVKQARHEQLLEKNELKQSLMNAIASQKQELNRSLASLYQQGVDINIYRTRVNQLEQELHSLYQLNARLGAIVLPVRQMYREIVEELTEQNGGQIYDIKA